MPRSVTIKVPVWRYDRGQPWSDPRPDGARTLYPSKFVGYVTFKTNKIYEMPGGIENAQAGAMLPSQY